MAGERVLQIDESVGVCWQQAQLVPPKNSAEDARVASGRAPGKQTEPSGLATLRWPRLRRFIA